ncbi:MAG: DegT/DnrJ/EryC1/StrS family aminotransferase [bacterium]|jgi:dTDP-4-amino-4,6-dideoxygalactose transaminase
MKRNILKVPFFRLKLGTPEKRAVSNVIESGWVTSGPTARALEEKIKKLVQARYAVAVSSATAGLHLSLKAAGIGPGDEVITSPYTMAATVEAILYAGAIPVFAEIDPFTLNIDPAQVAKRISRRTEAIIPVDIAGLPCDYDALLKIARQRKVLLIEDAAHSLGAQFQSKPIGSLCDATVFSFYSTKNVTTGEGGMVVTDSKILASRVRLLALHGMTSAGWKRYAGGGWKYDIVELGYKYNLSDLAAGLGLGQLTRFGEMQKKRELLAKRYIENLSRLGTFIETPYIDRRSRHCWHLFIIKIIPERLRITRDRFIRELEKRGIGCGVHFIPIYRFSYFRKHLKLKISDFPATESAYQRVISLPFYPDLTFAEVDCVTEKIAEICRHFRR